VGGLDFIRQSEEGSYLLIAAKATDWIVQSLICRGYISSSQAHTLGLEVRRLPVDSAGEFTSLHAYRIVISNEAPASLQEAVAGLDFSRMKIGNLSCPDCALLKDAQFWSQHPQPTGRMIGSQGQEEGSLANNAMIWNIPSSRGITGEQLAGRAALVLQELKGRYDGVASQFIVSATVTVTANDPETSFGRVVTKDPTAVRDLIRLSLRRTDCRVRRLR